MLYIIGLLLIIAILYFLKTPPAQIQSGAGLELNFSEITDDISDGNPISLSNKDNLPGVASLERPHYDKQNFTFWGHGIPLAGETKLGKFYGQRIPTLSAMNLTCSPKCCPSPYSCDHGCLCYQRDRKGGHLVGPNLRKFD